MITTYCDVCQEETTASDLSLKAVAGETKGRTYHLCRAHAPSVLSALTGQPAPAGNGRGRKSTATPAAGK